MERIADKSAEERATGQAAGDGRVWLFAALLAVAVAVVYADSLSGPFVFDDISSIEDNASIRDLRAFGAVLTPPKGGLTVSGRPLLNLTFAINYALGGLDVTGYHLTNVLLHALAALTLFGLVRRTLLREPLRGEYGTRAAGLSFLAALLWALHPLQTAAVTYTVQRAEVLCALFYLLALYAFVRSDESGDWRDLWLSLSVLACLMGMASKEVSATIPLAVLLYDRCFAAGTFRKALGARRGFYMALGVCWLFQFYLLADSGMRGGTVVTGERLTPLGYALTQFSAIATYLKLAVWPAPLIFDYGMPTAGDFWNTAFSAAVVLSLLGVSLYWFRARRPLGFCGVLFLLVLAPTSSFIPIYDTIFEHRMYLPLAALCVAFCLLAFTAWRRFAVGRSEWPLFAALLALSFTLGIVAGARNTDYRSALTLWKDTAEKRPGNLRAWMNTGMYYLENGDPDSAEKYYLRAEALAPNAPEVLSELGEVRALLGKQALAAETYGKALAGRPDDHKMRYRYGKALVASGNAAKGLYEMRRAVEGGNAPPLAILHFADELVRSGRRVEAIGLYENLAVLAGNAGDARLAAELEGRLKAVGARP